MDFLQSILFGIVEGITEFLPISSTGHLILTAKLLGLEQTDFLKTFEISIQLGAILSVVVLYWKTLAMNHEVLKRVITAFMPTAVIGLALYKIIKRVFFASEGLILWSLFLGGLFLIVFELLYARKRATTEELEKISYPTCLLIGLFQSIAMIPGVSRSAATIVGGLILGVHRKTIVEFSFLLAVPTMLAATGLDLAKNVGAFSTDQLQYLAVGFAVSFGAALLGVKFLLAYVKNHSFLLFGAYRVVLAVLFRLLVPR